jgi:hypothetical protein
MGRSTKFKLIYTNGGNSTDYGEWEAEGVSQCALLGDDVSPATNPIIKILTSQTYRKVFWQSSTSSDACVSFTLIETQCWLFALFGWPIPHLQKKNLKVLGNNPSSHLASSRSNLLVVQ